MTTKEKIEAKVDFYQKELLKTNGDDFCQNLVTTIEILENKENLTTNNREILIFSYSRLEDFYRLIVSIMIKDGEITEPETNDVLSYLGKLLPNIEITKWYQTKLMQSLWS